MSAPIPSTFYCDESGNSGANYIDDDQPFYVVGGFLIPDARLSEVGIIVEELRKKYSPQAKELKSGRLLRKHSGVACVGQAYQRLGALGALPVFVIAEKRYCVAAKIVDTFLDPLFNDTVESPLTYDVKTKQQLANDLHRLLEAKTLDMFAEAYRRPDPTTLGQALDHIVTETRSALNPETAILLDGARPHLAEIATSEGWQSGGDLDGINLPALLSLFQMIEAIGQTGVFSISSFVHDETASHEDAYHSAFMTWRGYAGQVIRFPHGAPPISRLEAISRFETHSSGTSPFIQAADLLAGALCGTCKKVNRQDTLREDEVELGGRLLAPLLVSSPHVIGWSVTSDLFIRRLGAALRWSSTNLSVPQASDVETLLPPIGANRAPTPSGPKASLPEPMWILTESDGRTLLVQPMSILTAEARDPGPILPVFSTEEAAGAFAVGYYSGAWLRARRLGVEPDGGRTMLQVLNGAAKSATYIAIDPNLANRWSLMSLPELITTIGCLMNRAQRARAAGVTKVLLQTHEVNGKTYTTVLLSTGEYAAEGPTSKRVVTGPNRDVALARAMEEDGKGAEG